MSYAFNAHPNASQASQRPLNPVDYHQAPSNETYGAGYKAPPKKNRSKWLWIAILVAIIVILGAVLGGVFGSRAKNNSKSSSNDSGSHGGSGGSGSGNGGSGTLNDNGSGEFAVKPVSTDFYSNPIYPSTTGSARIAAPSVSSNSNLACPADSHSFPSSGALTTDNVRSDHPRLIATASKWSCLVGAGGSGGLIAKDSYLSSWNATIFHNATAWLNADPVAYVEDGGRSGSGILDPAREIQNRVKHWAYAYRVSNDSRWVERTWRELLVASGNDTQHPWSEGNADKWNSLHFLDLAELTYAFAIAYDWMYDAWTTEQRTAIMWSIINQGLRYGQAAYGGSGWWRNEPGNWNCVCNNGLLMGSLAVLHDDPTGIAAALLPQVVANSRDVCAHSPSSDGTWNETPNYWYFGTTAHIQSALALRTATGSDNGLFPTGGTDLTGLFHMYTMGNQGLFSYGDSGPNKFTATANSLIAYGLQYDHPEYALFQRDRADAPEPMSVLYYDPQVTGQFWNGLALDHHFDNITTGWAAMRTSWTDVKSAYIGIKASTLTGHQTHGDLDVGTIVIDALGQRWAGELGNGDYLSNNYFASEAQNAERWTYYRKGTQGQNTLMLNNENQLVTAQPVNAFGSTGEKQDALVYSVPSSSTAFFTTDMTSAYGTSAHRGLRFLNGRRQILLQDEITVPSGQTVQWRLHSNATITLQSNNAEARFELGGETLIARILSPSGASFGTSPAENVVSTFNNVTNQPNPGVTVLTIDLAAGDQNIQVLFNPQWGSGNDVSPPSVPLADWSLTSHN